MFRKGRIGLLVAIFLFLFTSFTFASLSSSFWIPAPVPSQEKEITHEFLSCLEQDSGLVHQDKRETLESKFDLNYQVWREIQTSA